MRRKKPKTAHKVNSSHINPNETDEVLRKAIWEDEKEQQHRKAHPDEWTHVLENLCTLAPKEQPDTDIICNLLLSQWWDERFTPQRGPIYLPFREVHRLSKVLAIQTPEPSVGFEGGIFSKLYRSVVPHAVEKWVCFFLGRNEAGLRYKGNRGMREHPNRFFPVVFDYRAHKAYVFGEINGPDTKSTVDISEGVQSRWAIWLGPELWKEIGRHLGWSEEIGDPATVRVVAKAWGQVRMPSCCSYKEQIHTSNPDSLALTPGSVRSRSCRA